MDETALKTAADDTSRATARALGSYENEVRFYREIRDELVVRGRDGIARRFRDREGAEQLAAIEEHAAALDAAVAERRPHPLEEVALGIAAAIVHWPIEEKSVVRPAMA